MRLTPPPIYFMHLPRTGGTGLGKWLRTAYGRRAYVDLQVSRLPGMDAARLRGFSCYHSWHLGRGMFEWLNRPDLSCITLLRHPIERAVSDMYGIQRAALDHGQRFTAACLADLQPWLRASPDDCIRSGVMDRLLTNVQCRILGSRREYTFLQQAPRGTFWQPLNAVSWFDFPWLDEHAPAADADLQWDAASWLDAMAVVGLTERFAESLLLIGDLLGIPPPSDLPHANVNPKRVNDTMRYQDRLSPAALARLEELNQFDLDLYAQAQERFAEQWARYQARPRRTYSIAPRLRQLFHPLSAWLRHAGKPLRRAPALRQYVGWFGRRQGLRIYWATLFGPGGEAQIQTGRAAAPVHLRLRTSDFRIYGQVMGREEYALPLGQPPRVIVDAGANIGLSAVYFANRYPAASILAIEPEAANYGLLCKNVAAYPQIVPIRAALWDVPTTAALVGQPGLYGAVRVQMTEQPLPGTGMGEVATVTLTQLMADYQLDYVDLLKMDIEGAEQKVFAAAAPWIGQVNVIIAELHDRLYPGCALSFYAATRGFDCAWRRGEHIIVARRNFIQPDQAT